MVGRMEDNSTTSLLTANRGLPRATSSPTIISALNSAMASTSDNLEAASASRLPFGQDIPTATSSEEEEKPITPLTPAVHVDRPGEMEKPEVPEDPDASHFRLETQQQQPDIVTSTQPPPPPPLFNPRPSEVTSASEAESESETSATSTTSATAAAPVTRVYRQPRYATTALSLPWSSEPYHRPTRRERSLSSISSPYSLQAHAGHQRSSSAIIDLDYTGGPEAKAKRRSVSTCVSVSPPAKSARSALGGVGGPEVAESQLTSGSGGPSLWSGDIVKPVLSATRASRLSKIGGHVRFEDTPLANKCHHLLSAGGGGASGTGTGSGSGQQPEEDTPAHSVQRTQSNPEMELCPVCLARKECEILLKRTYSKRGASARERRKHSDPSIPRSTASDVDSDAAPPIADHQSGSSSTSSLSQRDNLPATAASKRGSAPRRTHTIGSITYDSKGYSGNKVSFLTTDAAQNAAGVSKGPIEDNLLTPSGLQHEHELSSRLTTHRKRTLSNEAAPSEAMSLEAPLEDGDSDANDLGIIRSRSFSGHVATSSSSSSSNQTGGGRSEREQTQPAAQKQRSQLFPPPRSKSMKQTASPTSSSKQRTRFSWAANDVPEGVGAHSPGLGERFGDLKNYRLRGSFTSLASLDATNAASGGSGGNTTPTSEPAESAAVTADISAKDLVARSPASTHAGNLELKKTTGFKAYKRYWAVLQSHYLYLYHREKDPKAKLVLDVRGASVSELLTGTALGSASASEVEKSGGSGGSFRESTKKRGRAFEVSFVNKDFANNETVETPASGKLSHHGHGHHNKNETKEKETRTFAASTREEAEEWMRKLRDAAAVAVVEVRTGSDDNETGSGGEGIGHELEMEDEVVLEAGLFPVDVQQEWRAAFRPQHHRNESSSSLDSPCPAGQAGQTGVVGGTIAGDLMTSNAGAASASAHTFPSTQTYWDSDFDTEPDPPDWRLTITTEELRKLRPREQKRQDVINEFFHTERSHVRNLKVLDRLFYRPLIESSAMSTDLAERLFPNLDEVLSLHNQYNQKMKERAKAGFPVGNIGDILTEMFDGTLGDTLIQVCAEFTKNQKMAIEELKERRRRDNKLDQFLSEQERRPECRRLGLQSILPVEHTRLVKYPLLLEQLAKQCDKDDEEFATVRRCVDRTREILESIDRQVAEAQNIQRMAEIQRNLDTSGLEKMPDSAICNEYRNIDLTKHRLIYDGSLTLKLGDTRRFKTVDLHVLLLEDCIMLLQKQDDKYLLKFHTSTASNASIDSKGNKFCHSPVIKFSTMLVRPVATDKRAFYLLNTTQNGPQIYELVASSTADRTQWFRHITEASNAYRTRDNRRGVPMGGSQNGFDPNKTDDHLGVPDKKGQPALRSQSFHEQSTSAREGHHERTPSSPPEDRDSPSKKAGEGEAGSRKRFQRVEILKIAEPCPLIDPSQVVVTQGEILVADPVLTPIEKIRRKDLEVAAALAEKHRLIAEYYGIPFEDVDNVGDVASHSTDRDAKEVLLAALVQVKSLSDLVNESLSLSEEDAVAAAARLSPEPPAGNIVVSVTNPNTDGAGIESEQPTDVVEEEEAPAGTVPTLSELASAVAKGAGGRSSALTSISSRPRGPPTGRLVAITSSMNKHLTSLLEIIQDRDEERERLRKELQRTQEQVQILMQPAAGSSASAEVIAPRPSGSLEVNSPSSRPVSFISVEEENSGPEVAERSQESEDDASLSLAASKDHPEQQQPEEESEKQDTSEDPTRTEGDDANPDDQKTRSDDVEVAAKPESENE